MRSTTHRRMPTGPRASISHGLTRRGTISGSVRLSAHGLPRGAAEPARHLVLRCSHSVLAGRQPQRFGSGSAIGIAAVTSDMRSPTAARRPSMVSTSAWIRAPLSRHAAHDLRLRPWTFCHGLASAAGSGLSRPNLQGRRSSGNVSFVLSVQSDVGDASELRTWLQYVPELANAVNTDGVSASLTGLFTPRMDFSLRCRLLVRRAGRIPATLRRLTPILRAQGTTGNHVDLGALCRVSLLLLRFSVPRRCPLVFRRRWSERGSRWADAVVRAAGR